LGYRFTCIKVLFCNRIFASIPASFNISHVVDDLFGLDMEPLRVSTLFVNFPISKSLRAASTPARRRLDQRRCLSHDPLPRHFTTTPTITSSLRNYQHLRNSSNRKYFSDKERRLPPRRKSPASLRSLRPTTLLFDSFVYHLFEVHLLSIHLPVELRHLKNKRNKRNKRSIKGNCPICKYKCTIYHVINIQCTMNQNVKT
jgi:hypothetical protein